MKPKPQARLHFRVTRLPTARRQAKIELEILDPETLDAYVLSMAVTAPMLTFLKRTLGSICVFDMTPGYSVLELAEGVGWDPELAKLVDGVFVGSKARGKRKSR